MKRTKKIMLRVIPIILVLMVIVTANVFATASPISPNLTKGTGSIGRVDALANNVWGTVALILQIAAVAAVVFAGVRYMFASADTKADIKKQMVILVIGAILVFGATTVINFIVNVTSDVLK